MAENGMTRIACVDFGGTGVRCLILEQDSSQDGPQGQPELRAISVLRGFQTSSPNDAAEDWFNLRVMLNQLNATFDFDAISVGFAGRLNKQGVCTTAGNLTDWAKRRWNLREMLEEQYHVPVLVANDGATLAAREIVFGALASPRLYGKSGLVVAPGTGVAVCAFLYLDGKYHILPGEGAHVVINGNPDALNPECCGRLCVESMASGRVLKQYAKLYYGVADPSLLTDSQVYAIMAKPLAGLIANQVRTLPNYLEVVVVGGGVTQHRPGLVAQVEHETRQQLGSGFDTPEFVISPHEEGGVYGAWAYSWLQQQSNGVPSLATV